MHRHTVKITFLITVLATTLALLLAYFLMPKAVATVGLSPEAQRKGTVPVLPAPLPEKRATLIAVGDIMLSRSVAMAIRKAGDVRYPFVHTRDLLHNADFVFANLETAITEGRVIKPGEMNFRADPNTVDGLKDAGITVVSLANNHVPNFGRKGILDTIAFLDAVEIAHAGAGKDEAAAIAPAIIERGGIRFAFLAFNDTDVVPDSYGAAPKRAGTMLMDTKKLATAIADARTRVDIVIVSMHSGTEYVHKPNSHQTSFAHAAIDAGADMVLGHHPHVVQTFEMYKNKPIIYSLGNFVFDQDWSEDTKKGLAARITFGEHGAERLEFIPIYSAKTGQPIIAPDDIRKEILKRLGVSDEIILQ